MTSADSTANTKRIAKNTLFLYIRMLLVMLITLYTSRIILDILGVVDFGIYNVVGGIVGMLGFLSSTMSYVVQRFLSFEMGKGNMNYVNIIFNISIQVHVLLAIVFVLLMELVGVWYLNNYINMPHDRLYAAHWVLQFSIITTFFTFIQIPFNGLIIAKEDMGVYAYISIIEVFLRLSLCYLLYLGSFDKLILYSGLMAAVTIIVVLAYSFYCKYRYPESKFKLVKDNILVKNMAKYASWNLLGEISWVFNSQAVNIVLNLFFGPVVNAASAISVQVNGAVSKFVTNFQMAVNPQIIKTYAAKEHDQTKKLLFNSIRLSYFLLLALSLPLIIEMESILGLWLKNVPDYTVLFCQLTLICSLVSSVSAPLSQIVRANGEIKNYQIAVSIVAFSCFPFSYIALYWGASAYSTIIINIFLTLLLLFVRFFYAQKYITISFRNFTMDVLQPIIKVTIIASFFSVLFKLLLGIKYGSLIVFSFSFFIACSVAYFTGMNQRERDYIKSYLNKTRIHNLKR